MPLARIRRLEDAILRAEGAVAVVVLVSMLLLSAYNIVYRNILVPLQRKWATSGPPVSAAGPEPVPSAPAPASGADGSGGAEGFAGGFGGGGSEDAEGFAGGFGVGGGAEAAEGFAGGFGGSGGSEDTGDAAVGAGEASGPAAEGEASGGDAQTEPGAAEADDAGGFGGGFGDDAPKGEDPAAAEGFAGGFGAGAGDDAGGFGGGFGEPAEGGGDEAAEAEAELARLLAQAESAPAPPATPVGGPPPPGSFEARAVAFVDALKLDWIDIVLRQGVILLGFLGAAFATRRRKHVNIDALSKVLPSRVQRVVALLVDVFSTVVCLVLATAGWRLVRISREFPKELVSWADEWTFQLMFPVGFGLLALHFAVRIAESAHALARGGEGTP